MQLIKYLQVQLLNAVIFIMHKIYGKKYDLKQLSKEEHKLLILQAYV